MKKMNSYKNVQQNSRCSDADASVCLDSRTVHSKITILIIHDESCTVDHLFIEMIFSHYRQRRSPGIQSSSAVFFPTVMNSILLSLHVTSHWSTIYHALFVSWGLGRYPSSIISKCYGYACLFALLRMIYCCLCSVFNMQTTLVNQAGINTIILYQTVRDAIYWMWGTCFILGS